MTSLGQAHGPCLERGIETARHPPTHERGGAGVDQPLSRRRGRGLPDSADREQHAAGQSGIRLSTAR